MIFSRPEFVAVKCNPDRKYSWRPEITDCAEQIILKVLK